jgi:hypothetical protein
LRKGESPVLPGEEREETAESMVGAGGVCRQRECFSFSGAFKSYTTPQEGRGGWSAHLWATYMSPKLFLLLACLHKYPFFIW